MSTTRKMESMFALVVGTSSSLQIPNSSQEVDGQASGIRFQKIALREEKTTLWG